jgi:hypothetical protein
MLKPLILAIVCLPFLVTKSFSCSMCKVTINGHTYLGNNEDSWRLGSRIWFENGISGNLGAVYVGYANMFPQGGMNEAGLAFDGLTTLPKPLKKSNGLPVGNALEFVKRIMQTCRTVEDVRRFAILYNRQEVFNNGEYMFADRSGHYLVMESDTLLMGNDDKYLIANFCPSITAEKQKLSWDRYRRGIEYIRNHPGDTNTNYTLALVDTMHECREKMGDGTMYSFVADLDKGELSLYFYHDFTHGVRYNLEQELAKGDHVTDMLTIFPANKEYQQLISYKTPQKNVLVLGFLYLVRGLFFFTAIFFIFSLILNKRINVIQKNTYPDIKMGLAAISVLLVYLSMVLTKNENFFYFPSPYHEPGFSLINAAGYIPFLLLVLVIPFIRWNILAIRNGNWSLFSKGLFVVNNLSYLCLIALFIYWGFYNIF